MLNLGARGSEVDVKNDNELADFALSGVPARVIRPDGKKEED